jgi:hypothetical protein
MKRLSDGSLRERNEDAPVNPMDSVANLADAMLVLAVGIMLALIINWNVDISHSGTQASASSQPTEFTQSDLTKAPENAEEIEGGDLTKLGTVYRDEKTGTYYIVENKESGQ